VEPLRVPYSPPDDWDERSLPLTPLQMRLMWSELESLRRQRDDAKQERLRLQAQCDELARSAISPTRVRLLRNELEALRKQRDEAREEYRGLQAVREELAKGQAQLRREGDAEELQSLRGEREHLAQERDLWKLRCEELAAGREGPAGERVRALERALASARDELGRDAQRHRSAFATIETRLEAAQAEKDAAHARAEELKAGLSRAEAEIRRLWKELSQAQAAAQSAPEDPFAEILRQACDDLAVLTARKVIACRAAQDSERSAWDDAARRLSAGGLDADGRITVIGSLLRRLAERTAPEPQVPPAPQDGEWDSVRRMITSARAELAKLRAGDSPPIPVLPREEPRGRPGAFPPRLPRTRPTPFQNNGS
jgi:hypothetical protein